MKNNIDKPLDIAVDQELNQLADNITSLVNETKSHLAQVINTTMVVTYWNIGRYNHSIYNLLLLNILRVISQKYGHNL